MSEKGRELLQQMANNQNASETEGGDVTNVGETTTSNQDGENTIDVDSTEGDTTDAGVSNDGGDNVNSDASSEADATDSEDNQNGDSEEDNVNIDIDIDLDSDGESTDSIPADFLNRFKDDGIESPSDLVNNYQKIKSDLEKFKSEATSYKETMDKLPDNLKDAVEIAQNGGDFLDYLEVASVDYDSIDPTTLYLEHLREQVNPQSQEEIEDFEAYVDNLPMIDVKIKGQELKNKLISTRQEKIKNFKESSIQRSNERREKALNALEGFDKIGDFKVGRNYKKQMSEAIKGGDIQNVILGDTKGGIDYDKAIKMDFIYRNFEKITDVLKTQSRNAQKSEIIADRGNHVQTNGSKVSSSDKTSSSPFGKLFNQVKQRAENN